MKNIIVIIFSVIALGIMVLTYQGGPAFHGGEAGKIIEDMSKSIDSVSKRTAKNQNENQEQDKLKALRDKAGNVASFKVSAKYKSKCASCHGVNGSGEQNGKRLMGPRVFGQSEAKLYKSLVDFKAGRKENAVMRGLLLGLSDDDLKELSKEISEFKARAEAQK